MPVPAPTADEIFAAIAHGDAVHRAWLREAIDALFAGRPVPRLRPLPDTGHKDGSPP